MKTVAVMLAVLIVAAVCATAVAQEMPRRDGSGAVMDLSRRQSMPTYEFMLNIVDLPGAEFTRAQRRVRNKGIPHERVRFDGNGSIFVEHILVGVYRAYVGERLLDRAYVDALLGKFGQRRGQVFEAKKPSNQPNRVPGCGSRVDAHVRIRAGAPGNQRPYRDTARAVPFVSLSRVLP